MPNRRPTQAARFNIALLYTRGEFTLSVDRLDDPNQTEAITVQLSREHDDTLLFRLDNPIIHSMRDRLNATEYPTTMRLQPFDTRDPNYPMQPRGRQYWLVFLREAGMWFADIAHICGYPSASSASAAYVRECRLRGLEPRVREQNSRVRRQIEEVAESNPRTIPDFLQRSHFQGEFADFGFGVEIEQAGIGRGDIVRTIQGLGFPVSTDTSYRHGDVEHWKAVPDASLSGSAVGECVSRKLRGFDGLVELREVQLALKRAGARVNASCGQHIHIGIEPFSQRTLAMVIRQHAQFQPVFDLLVKRARRNNQSYAKHTQWDIAMGNAEAFEQGNVHAAYMDKMRSLNLNHYEGYGTFEFRSFHGCLNPRFTVAWLQLHFDFMSLCERITRLTNSGVKEVLHFGDVQEVRDLQAAMPLTMRYVKGLAEQTVNGVIDMGEEFNAWATATNYQGSTNSNLSSIRQTLRAGNHRTQFGNGDLVTSACFIETGANASYNNGRFLPRGCHATDRIVKDAAWASRWGADGDTSSLLRADTCSETRGGDTLNPIALWAMPILREWVSETSFVGNPQVRKALRELCREQFTSLDDELHNAHTRAWTNNQ